MVSIVLKSRSLQAFNEEGKLEVNIAKVVKLDQRGSYHTLE